MLNTAALGTHFLSKSQTELITPASMELYAFSSFNLLFLPYTFLGTYFLVKKQNSFGDTKDFILLGSFQYLYLLYLWLYPTSPRSSKLI